MKHEIPFWTVVVVIALWGIVVFLAVLVARWTSRNDLLLVILQAEEGRKEDSK